jgi:hypothetical protein
MGDDYWSAPNPDYGVTFSYYLKEGSSTLKQERKKKEKALGDADIPFPGWEALEDEMQEKAPAVYLEIFNSQGNRVQRVRAANAKGFHRTTWDLSIAGQGMIDPDRPFGGGRGFMALPGTFSAQLVRVVNGETTQLGTKVTFEVKPLHEKTALEGKSKEEIMAFRTEVEAFQNRLMRVSDHLSEAQNQLKAMQTALSRSVTPDPALMKDLHDAEMAMMKLDSKVNGNLAKREVREVMPPTLRDRMFTAYRGLMGTYGPTDMHKASLAAGQEEFKAIHEELHPMIHETLPALMERLKENGAPAVKGMGH